MAQDTTWYGHDLDPSCTLEDLLEKLLTISGLKWLRILYAHPYHVTERLLDLVESEEALCPYLDIPIQHVNPDILRAMGRPLERQNSTCSVSSPLARKQELLLPNSEVG
ncbi:MAG: hypothetical protein JRF50_07725 [Deltaproteobacteria bacterium]|nr:hypothetical protein [Deltaproteobacteria bacterium]